MATPPVVTVFSAPNYCGRYGNRGAFLRVLKHPTGRAFSKNAFRPLEIIEPVQFSETDHPTPLNYGNHQEELEGGIHRACPYLPTTFYGFSTRALDLLRTRSIEMVVPASPDTQKQQQQVRAAAKPKAPKFKSPTDLFKSAAESDSLNEKNPVVVAEKVALAKKRLSLVRFFCFEREHLLVEINK